jgi:DNA polymerase III delta prime subunit
MRDEFLWVEKYRPKTIDDCILPESLKRTFGEFVENKEIPNLLFSGTAGIGKTTVARALCEQLDADYILINGSEESGIDVLRNKIKNFASTVSLAGGTKVVILDEADYLNPQSTQPALRGFIEEFSKNCRFIFTCNFANRIIAPLHSRCSVVEFRIPRGSAPTLAANFLKRVWGILDQESIEYDKKVVAELITKYLPDWRRILNELQRYSAGGVIDTGILSSMLDVNLDQLVIYIKEQRFTDMRKWVVDNLDNDPNTLYRKLYDSLSEILKPQTIPVAVLTIADFSYKSAFVVDQEINLVACLTRLMVECEFK